jgi:iron(III) transport system substrate-binding protein
MRRAFLILPLFLAACGAESPPLPPEEGVVVPRGGSVTIYVEAPRHNAGPILKSFTEQSGIEIHAVYQEALGTQFLPRLQSEAADGRVDLFWGTSPLSALALARAGLAVPFRPAGARPVPSQYRDPGFLWIGFAANPRVIIYNTEKVSRDDAPTSMADMAAPPWGGRGAIGRIRGGPSGFHAAALASLWGFDRARAFFGTLAKNGTKIVEDDSAVRRAVASGEALWGIVGLDQAICANREAEPVHIVFPDRLSLGAVVVPYVAVLMRKAPHPPQAKGLFAFLFSSEAAFQLGQNDCAMITLLQDIPKPEWVPTLSMLNVTRLDTALVYQTFRDQASFFESWGAPPAAAPGGQAAGL